MRFEVGQIVVWIITGMLAGFLAGQLFRRRGFGLLGNLILGLLGALLGGALFQLLNINLRLPELRFSFQDLIAAFVGAAILVLFVRFLQRR